MLFGLPCDLESKFQRAGQDKVVASEEPSSAQKFERRHSSSAASLGEPQRLLSCKQNARRTHQQAQRVNKERCKRVSRARLLIPIHLEWPRVECEWMKSNQYIKCSPADREESSLHYWMLRSEQSIFYTSRAEKHTWNIHLCSFTSRRGKQDWARVRKFRTVYLWQVTSWLLVGIWKVQAEWQVGICLA